jgi:hypothetical protein
MTINDPEVVAELAALYPRYEEALVANDVDTLTEMFWAGRHVMRFGVTENLCGPEELAAFRRTRPAANLARTITRLDIVSFGRDFASITLEFERTTPPVWSVAGRVKSGSGYPRAGALSRRMCPSCGLRDRSVLRSKHTSSLKIFRGSLCRDGYSFGIPVPNRSRRHQDKTTTLMGSPFPLFARP